MFGKNHEPKKTAATYNEMGGDEMEDGQCCGDKLNLAAVVLANYLSRDMNVEQLNLLSSFAQLVGEALAVNAAAKDCFENKGSLTEK